MHLSGVQEPVPPPHMFGVPPPPHDCPVGQVPQFGVSPPQPSPWRPQVPFGKFAHVFGVHVDVGGGPTQEARSQIMYSRIRSWELSAVRSHSVGKVVPSDCLALLT